MSEHRSTASKKPVDKRTPQQWAWQFLRRNPKYIEAYALISSLTMGQYAQLQGLIALQKGLDIDDSYFDEEVIDSLDHRFFETDRYLPAEDSNETKGRNPDKAVNRKFIEDPLSIRVCQGFFLETYCLNRWLDPTRFLEIDADVADTLWDHHPSIEWGLAYAPWLSQMDGANSRNFRPVHRVGRSFNVSSERVESLGYMVRGADGKMYMRSPTVWSRDYELPKLNISEVDVRFDLNLPLKIQIKCAEAELKKHQGLLRTSKILDRHASQVDKNGAYEEYLLILDRLSEGATTDSLTLEIEPVEMRTIRRYKGKKTEPMPKRVLVDPTDPLRDKEKITESVRQKKVRALRLRDNDYKVLAFL